MIKKSAPVTAPRLHEDNLTPQDLKALELEAETDICDLQLSGLARGDAFNAKIARVVFQAARLGAVSWSRAHFEDAIWRECDFANADAREIFASRVEMIGCRALGLNASESSWRDARFGDCNLSLAQFRFAKMGRTRFENCDLRGADFSNADVRGAVFRDCDLSGAQFSFAQLENADWRTCRTEELQIGADALRGLIVSPLQAAQFAAVLGLQVRWSDEDMR